MAKGPYQIRRVVEEGVSVLGKYKYALICMDTPQPNEFGFSVITTMHSNGIVAPEYLRKRQATLNSVRMLNEMGIN